MDARATVDAYYDALRDGEPLGEFFAADSGTVKIGISETLRGHDAVVEGLAHQTETTSGWTVESRDRLVEERETFAWFADDVALGWTDAERRIRYEFETRWTGTLERRDGGWKFVSMHVSTAGDL